MVLIPSVTTMNLFILKGVNVISTKTLSYIALMTTLLIVLGFIPAIPLGFIPVPIVLQNMGVMLIALLLGAKNGTIAMSLFFILGLVFPVFSGKATLIPVLTGPTAGYVVAWFLLPLVVYLLRKVILKNHFLYHFMITWVAGVLFVDVLGAIWLSLYTGGSLQASLISNLVFIPLDTVKALLATYLFSRFKGLVTL